MSQTYSAPLVQPNLAREIASGVTVIPDQRIYLVPNVGFIIGEDAVLIVDSGLGLENGKSILQKAQELAQGKPLWFTSTHAHPEHNSGAQAFKGHATIILNTNQGDDLRDYGNMTLDLFRQQMPGVAPFLEGVSPVIPDETYQGEKELDLGGKRVLLRELPAHSHGDQIIFLPQERILFTGDLVESHFTPLFFDPAVNGGAWIEALAQMKQLSPTIVVPGHGELGNATLLQEYQDYLLLIRAIVQERADRGQTFEAIAQEGSRMVQEQYPTWGYGEWIPLILRTFYSEVTGITLPPPTF